MTRVKLPILLIMVVAIRGATPPPKMMPNCFPGEVRDPHLDQKQYRSEGCIRTEYNCMNDGKPSHEQHESFLIDQPQLKWKPDRGENNTGNDKGWEGITSRRLRCYSCSADLVVLVMSNLRTTLAVAMKFL
jgi:hypothetical protein